MGFIDAFRRAEKKGKDVVRRGREAVHQTSEDAQRRARQKMRVYPPRSSAPAQNQNEIEQAATARELEDARRKAIVSVNGEDVDEKDLNNDRKIA